MFVLQHSDQCCRGLAKLRWVSKELADETSPIFGWKRALIMEAVDTMKRESVVAKTERYCPVTLVDLAPYIRDILKTIIPTLRSKAVVFVGKPGWGKTPLMQSLSMAVSQYWINNADVETHASEPGFRTAECLDFFRGEEGFVERPDIFDDGDLNVQPVASLKAFLDVGRVEGTGCAAH